jgi:flagellar hook-length control protein FliK
MQPLALNQSSSNALDSAPKRAAQAPQSDRTAAFARHLATHGTTTKPETTAAQQTHQTRSVAQPGEKKDVDAHATDTEPDSHQKTPSLSEKTETKNTEDKPTHEENVATRAIDLVTQMLNLLAPHSIQNIGNANDQHVTPGNTVDTTNDESGGSIERMRDRVGGRSSVMLPGQTDEETAYTETSASITTVNAGAVSGTSASDIHSKHDFAKALTSHEPEQKTAPTASDISPSPISQLTSPQANTQASAPANASATQFSPTSNIPYAVGTGPWNEHITHQIKWMIGGDQQSATLTLNPPELGPLHITVQIDQGQANTSFGTDNPDVQRAIEQSIPKLREALADAGFSLGQASVTQFASNSQTSGGSSRERERNSAATLGVSHGMSTSITSGAGAAGSPAVARISNGLVDTYA